MQGFIVNDATVTGIGTSYAIGDAILLHEDSAADARSRAMPQSCYLSHIDLQLDETGGTASTVDLFLSWDSGGDDPMTGESSGNALWSGLTDTSLRNTSIALGVWVTAPSGQTTAGKCYLFIKVAGTTPAVSATKVRLHWSDRANV